MKPPYRVTNYVECDKSRENVKKRLLCLCYFWINSRFSCYQAPFSYLAPLAHQKSCVVLVFCKPVFISSLLCGFDLEAFGKREVCVFSMHDLWENWLFLLSSLQFEACSRCWSILKLTFFKYRFLQKQNAGLFPYLSGSLWRSASTED